jgi:hypothetical protein
MQPKAEVAVCHFLLLLSFFGLRAVAKSATSLDLHQQHSTAPVIMEGKSR